MIMLVDDQPETLQFMQRILDRQGWPHAALDGPLKALDMLQDENARPSLLITDYQMPALDGVELVERARQQHPNLPAIIASAMPEEEIGLPPDTQLLSKPFRMRDFLAAIRLTLPEAEGR